MCGFCSSEEKQMTIHGKENKRVINKRVKGRDIDKWKWSNILRKEEVNNDMRGKG